MSTKPDINHPVGDWIDLAAVAFGGEALLASDEFFAGKENLLEPGRGIFLPDEYTERGKWMDGWESRRRRTPGHDWCIIRLGCPGQIVAVTIDTNHFLGNHPPFGSVDACYAPNATDVQLRDEVVWTPIVSGVPLARGTENWSPVQSTETWTHVRLNIYPAGGVARFRAWGRPRPEKTVEKTNLAALELGAVALCCSDMFFSPMNNLLKAEPSTHMGDGWETRRSRPPGKDWVVIRLGLPGVVDSFLVDTAHFKGNYPQSVRFEGVYWPDAPPWVLATDADWTALGPPANLGADREHEIPSTHDGPVTHIRMTIIPDGGVARLRVHGTPSSEHPAAGDPLVTFINTISEAECIEALLKCCGARRWADAMAEARPFTSRAALFGEAERLWWSLGDGDWKQAFTHHPQIGADIESLKARFAQTADWSAGEQASVGLASDEVLTELAQGNRTYLERFGFIFIVCATGKSAQEMLDLLNNRLPNEPAAELRIAAGEQAKITRLRLSKLVTEEEAS